MPESSDQRHEAQHGGDEAATGRSRRPTLKNNSANGMCPSRQADLAQRAGKAEPVQQAERERHDPRRSAPSGPPGPAACARSRPRRTRCSRRSPPRPARTARARMPSVASAERDAVRDRERGHRLHQPPRPARDDEQRQHEQQMIDAEQDVLDAELEIDARPPTSRSGGGGIVAAGCCGVSRRTQELPSRNATRTRASVMVLSRPAMRDGLAAQRIERPQAPGLHRGIARGPRGHRRRRPRLGRRTPARVRGEARRASASSTARRTRRRDLRAVRDRPAGPRGRRTIADCHGQPKNPKTPATLKDNGAERASAEIRPAASAQCCRRLGGRRWRNERLYRLVGDDFGISCAVRRDIGPSPISPARASTPPLPARALRKAEATELPAASKRAPGAGRIPIRSGRSRRPARVRTPRAQSPDRKHRIRPARFRRGIRFRSTSDRPALPVGSEAPASSSSFNASIASECASARRSGLK